MRNIFLIMLAILIISQVVQNTAIAQECADRTKLENRELIRSEDIGDEPGLYVLKIMKASEVHAVMIAWQDLMKQKKFTQQDMLKFKVYAYIFEDFFTIEFREKKQALGDLMVGQYIYIK